MASSDVIVTYEVYVLEDGRWMLHARLRQDQKDEALNEARLVEKNLGLCVKVHRESYNSDRNVAEDLVVYLSPNASKADAALPTVRTARPGSPAGSRPGGGGGAARPKMSNSYSGVMGSAAPTSADLAVARANAGAVVMLFRLSAIIIISIIVAGMVAGTTSLLAGKFGALNGDVLPKFLFGVFIVTFLVTAVPLAMAFVHFDDGPARPYRPEPRRSEPKPKPAPEKKIEVEVKEEPPEEEKEEEKPDEDEGEEEEDENSPSQSFERNRLVMMKFLGATVTAVKGAMPSLDAYNKFGIDLLLSGALEVLAGREGLDPPTKHRLLCQTIQVMGTRRELAEAFADKHEQYMLEPKYMHMVQAGRDCMENFMADSPGAHAILPDVMKAWNKPQSTATQPAITTVIFTDMVGSTDMTQARGDQTAQEVVRRHNRIVRTALRDYDGKEIKHTGDGIMASFGSAANAVEATIAIQRATDVDNQNNAHLPMKLRIGINAGEPIQEENDLFGATVQLAARVCAKADSDEIFCSNVVRELSGGRNLSFRFRGEYDLKGFRDKIPLYEAVWRPGEVGDEAAAEAPAEATLDGQYDA